ncbi:DUF1624 domain-containing protein [bacterium]|nr:DUF1624 domain-containing protein [bacterium]
MKTERLLSLDVFRGLTVALMILVNNPGSWAHIHPPLRHAAWHGWTPTDLVFPFFLFAVGAAISLAFARRRAHGATPADLRRKIAVRTAAIFVVGLLLNGFPYTEPAHWRWWGVLQRIALCYGAAALVVVATADTRRRLAVAGAALLAYELLMRLPLVAGWGGGSFALADNFVRWVDLRWPGAAHLYAGAGVPFDPEGLVSTLPTVAGTLAGVFAGDLLRAPDPLAGRLRRLALAGVVATGTGLALGRLEPVNKQLWTVSYTVLTSGLAALLLAACAWALDVRGWRRGTAPALVFGSNALLAFVGSGLLARVLALIRVDDGDAAVSLRTWLYRHLCAAWAGPVNGSLVFALGTVVLWWALLRELHRRGIFVRI